MNSNNECDVEFSSPNVDENDNNLNMTHDLGNNNIDEVLNSPISGEEITESIKSLKNSKSPGMDNIIHEYLKSTIDGMLNFYTILFNKILDTGNIPSVWLSGIIVPIYKNKGDRNDPDAYRGITMVSAVGKMFTAI